MGKDKKDYALFSKVHHIGIVVRDIEQSARLLENFGLGRLYYPSLPGWLEKMLFHYKPFDREFKFLGFGPYIHPALFKILDMGANPLDPVFPPVTGGYAKFNGKPMKSHYIIYKAKLGDKLLELLQPVSGESPWQEFLDANGEGIHHIAFEVDDLQKAEDLLVKQGATLVMEARLQGIKGAEGGDYLDLGTGVVVEIFNGYY